MADMFDKEELSLVGGLFTNTLATAEAEKLAQQEAATPQQPEAPQDGEAPAQGDQASSPQGDELPDFLRGR